MYTVRVTELQSFCDEVDRIAAFDVVISAGRRLVEIFEPPKVYFIS
jgi:hypothetical protein